MKDEIINFIKDNRLSTADVSDALGKKGEIRNIHSLNRGSYCVGEVEYICSFYGSNYDAHKGLHEAPKGKILFFDTHQCDDKAVFGHLMYVYAMHHKESIAVVVNGWIRDVEKMTGPVWYKGFSPTVCSKNKDLSLPAHEASLISSPYIEGKQKMLDFNKMFYQDGIMVCDDTGVVVIAPGHVNQDTYQKLVAIRDREKEWYAKLSKGLSTFEIVCQ